MRVTIGAAVTWLYAVAGGCVQADALDASRQGAPAAEITLRVLDQREIESKPSAMPRRPQLWLTHPHGLQPDPDRVLLLSGVADDDLHDDLSAAPLRAEHLTRAVPCSLASDGDALVLAPAEPLAAGEPYTLALAGNARDAAGRRLFADGAPWIVELQTERGDQAGARVLATWPADGASAVPTNLAAAVLALDGEVIGAQDGAWLEGPDGLAVPAAIAVDACARIAPEHAAARCIRITPEGLLAPNAPYALVLGTDARDAHGAAIGPYRTRFRSAGGPDRAPPGLRLPSCAIDELAIAQGCVLADDQSLTLHLIADEPALFSLTTAVPAGPNGQAARAAAPAGEVALALSELEPDREYALELVVRDAADNSARERFTLRTARPLAALSIVELRPDPLGPEPAQELVELLNYGTRPVQLQGFSLGDRLDVPAPAIASEAVLQPAARALLVADGFDAREPSEPQPPAGALLVRVGKALASGGLRNSGEPLYLRDPDGRRVSAAPGRAPGRAGDCLARVVDDMRSGAASAFTDAVCTPGW